MLVLKEVIKVRLATYGDAAKFLELEARCFEMTPNMETTYFWTPIVENLWAYKAMVGDRIVGGIIAMPTRDGEWYIDSLFVDPEYQKQGVASLLMNRVLAVAGNHTVVLDVKTDRSFLLDFYARFGFVVSARMPNYYNDGSDRLLLVKEGRETSTAKLAERPQGWYYAQFLVTMPRDLYTRLVAEALARGASVNQVIEDGLRGLFSDGAAPQGEGTD